MMDLSDALNVVSIATSSQNMKLDVKSVVCCFETCEKVRLIEAKHVQMLLEP